MTRIRIGAAYLNQTPLDWEGNRARIRGALAEARQAGVKLLLLPELCVTGYGCEDTFLSSDLIERAWKSLELLLPATKDLAVLLGLPVKHDGALYNCGALIGNGQLFGVVPKQKLCREGVYYEPRWFTAWERGRAVKIEADGQRVPFGDLIFDIGGVRVGVEICEDAWQPGRPAPHLAARGAQLILNPSASHFAFGKHELRRDMILDASSAHGVAYAYANLVGCESGRLIFDGDCIIASGDRIVASGDRFSFSDFGVTAAELDLPQPATAAGAVESWLVPIPGSLTPAAGAPQLKTAVDDQRWVAGKEIKEEEFTRSAALGLFDYLRKSRSSGFVVSLSGGADSSAASLLVAYSFALAEKQLGINGVINRLSHIPSIARAHNHRELTTGLLTCVYQATRNSSNTTFEAARSLAESLGARFIRFEIDDLVNRYVDMAGSALGHKFDWAADDIALQNIQARARSPGVWLIANKLGALLLCTSNRSEAAVGYATMDGDTSGGLTPLGGIDKAYLLYWLRWVQRHAPRDLWPVPVLEQVVAQQPTAELRPPAAKQTDEADLMPYALLERIEDEAVLRRKSPLQTFLALEGEYSEIAPERLAEFVIKFYRLWSQSQWKRERYAPAFHLDDKSLDPKSWCRFPILSGGYREELEELQQFLRSRLEDSRGK